MKDCDMSLPGGGYPMTFPCCCAAEPGCRDPDVSSPGAGGSDSKNEKFFIPLMFPYLVI
jgi:hypothetical protein